jgi:hypothetical protein
MVFALPAEGRQGQIHGGRCWCFLNTMSPAEGAAGPKDAPETPAPETRTESAGHKHSSSNSSLHNAKGWDGKLRVEKRAVLVNPEVLDGQQSDAEESDDEDHNVEQIEADEGMYASSSGTIGTTNAQAQWRSHSRHGR